MLSANCILGHSYDQLPLFDKDLSECWNVNVVGALNSIAAFIPLIKKGKIRKVFALSSGMGDLDFTNELDMDMAVPYSISKAALNMVMSKFAATYKKDGILFMSISPGAVDSEDDGRGTNAPVVDVEGALSQSLYPVRPWHKDGEYFPLSPWEFHGHEEISLSSFPIATQLVILFN